MSTLDKTIAFRLLEGDHDAFKARCDTLGREYQDMLREFITAFNDGRLRIVLTEQQQKTHEDTYHGN